MLSEAEMEAIINTIGQDDNTYEIIASVMQVDTYRCGHPKPLNFTRAMQCTVCQFEASRDN